MKIKIGANFLKIKLNQFITFTFTLTKSQFTGDYSEKWTNPEIIWQF